MNYEIKIIEESEINPRSMQGTVSAKMLNILESNKNIGGFRRFDIDVFCETKSSPTIKSFKKVISKIIN